MEDAARVRVCDEPREHEAAISERERVLDVVVAKVDGRARAVAVYALYDPFVEKPVNPRLDHVACEKERRHITNKTPPHHERRRRVRVFFEEPAEAGFEAFDERNRRVALACVVG